VPGAKKGEKTVSNKAPAGAKAVPVPKAAPAREAVAASKAAERMDGRAFARCRALMKRSQRELADILGVSLKAVESYEQGWRRVPANIERILYFLLFKLNEASMEGEEPCWVLRSCSEADRKGCAAYLAREGHYCWFFTGRLCAACKKSGGIETCYSCEVFARLYARIDDGGETPCP
jgi:DNA-binding transcriptional regulator YiaG